MTIPKEAEPDIKIPIIYVQLSQRGISPEDAERLLLRPVETQLKSVRQRQGNALDRRSRAAAIVLLEFEAGFDSESALADVRAKVDDAKRDLPRTSTSHGCSEVNLSLYPVLVVTLSGDMPERSLLRHRARRQERDRAGAGRAVGGTARRARRGGRDHRRADADEAATACRSSSSIRIASGVQQPGRGRRARRRSPAVSPSRCRR